jgi:hypothetical protein
MGFTNLGTITSYMAFSRLPIPFMPSLREGFFPPKTGIFGRKTTEYTCFWRILSPNGLGAS